MGRKREYRNDAEKQKAYRERKKQEKASLMLLEQHAKALRKTLEYFTKTVGKFQVVVINRNFAAIEVNRRFRVTVNVVAVEYLVLTGELTEVQSRFRERRFVCPEKIEQ